MSVNETTFQPSVAVFDANVALGRRHDRRVTVDTVHGTLAEMDRAGVDRALVYSPHAVFFDSRDGNRTLLDTVGSQPRLAPQFVCNPAFDDLEEFAGMARRAGVRSVRMLPALHGYPFLDWVVAPWLQWAAEQEVAIWMPLHYGAARRGELHAGQLDPASVYQTLSGWPQVSVVLSEVQYRHANWALKLLEALPNLHIEISRFVGTDGIGDLLGAAGPGRVLLGSRFPESPMAAQLYNLHHCGLDDETLTAICSGNLERLLAER